MNHPQQVPPADLLPKKEHRFAQIGRFNDAWCAVLFLLGVVGAIVISAFSYTKFQITDATFNIPGMTPAFLGALFGTVIAAGGITSLVYFLLIHKYAGTMIPVTLSISVLLKLAYAGYLFYAGSIPGAVAFGLFGLASGIKP